MDNVLKVPGFRENPSLVYKLAKSPRGGFFFSARLKKIRGKKPHPPGAFPEIPLYPTPQRGKKHTSSRQSKKLDTKSNTNTEEDLTTTENQRI